MFAPAQLPTAAVVTMVPGPSPNRLHLDYTLTAHLDQYHVVRTQGSERRLVGIGDTVETALRLAILPDEVRTLFDDFRPLPTTDFAAGCHIYLPTLLHRRAHDLALDLLAGGDTLERVRSRVRIRLLGLLTSWGLGAQEHLDDVENALCTAFGEN